MAAGGRSRARRPGSTALSGREREILGMLATGHSGTRIAERLVLSPETVRTHIRNAMAKLGASSRAQAVALAFRTGEIDAGGQAVPTAANTANRSVRSNGSAGVRQAALRGRRSDATLTAVLLGLVSLYDVDGGAVYLIEEDGLSLRRVALLDDGSAPEAERTHPGRLALGEGPLGRAALERRAQVIHADGGPQAGGRTLITAPMTGAGILAGVISLTTRPSRLTGRDEMLLLQAFASRVADVLAGPEADQTARLKEALERFRASWSAAGGNG